MKEHLLIAAQLVKAAKMGDSGTVADAEKKWYANADHIATFLNCINPYLPKEVVKAMLDEHLALTKSEAVARLSKNYATDIALYDKIELQALRMADALTDGIARQFHSPDATNYVMVIYALFCEPADEKNYKKNLPGCYQFT